MVYVDLPHGQKFQVLLSQTQSDKIPAGTVLINYHSKPALTASQDFLHDRGFRLFFNPEPEQTSEVLRTHLTALADFRLANHQGDPARKRIAFQALFDAKQVKYEDAAIDKTCHLIIEDMNGREGSQVTIWNESGEAPALAAA